jgi:hypothetical protein
MNINAAIIDQRVNALIEEIRQNAKDILNINQDEKLKSLAFVYLTVKTVLDISDEESFDCLTEGGGDFGIDALHISEEVDNEFTVTLFQGKYKQKLDGNAGFEENAVKKLLSAIRYLFDPNTKIANINQRLAIKLEAVRSLIRDGYIPQVRVIACSNGLRWNQSTDEEIKRANLGNQVSFEHINHDNILLLLQSSKPVNDSLRLSGKAIVENFNFSRVFIGRVSVNEIAALIERHGERLLERNIRRYLGLQGNRVNEAISFTLKTEQENFYFYNNGITLTCDKFSHNELQQSDYLVKINNLQIINGGQTCMTLFKSIAEQREVSDTSLAYVLVRLYELPSENEDFVRQITFATNSQNPVDLKDLKANDAIQRRLETDITQLGFNYRRKRSDSSLKNTDITIGVAAEAILAVWRKKPHQAKFFTREHFGKLYAEIFTEQLNGAQVIIAVLLYRVAENYRKRPPEKSPLFISYASCFIAMQMGKYLLSELNIVLPELNHQKFLAAESLVEQNGNSYFQQACENIDQALKQLYNGEVSAQQLSATFRRGDLIEKLNDC